MMIKGTNNLMFHQQQQQQEENMSNLTSASGEASVSSGNRNEYLPPPPSQSQPPLKKKRNLPGNPDPGAEVIALSPKTLLATNRFVCEICNKGFQRDQNLQLHRRGHNLPWKLKQRTDKEIVRKKVYVCPETSCVHHDPSRALGDLTGIKKHFCRKHGEKKWKCEKCSKKYAVQSDWKAHSKTCGTREYRCDCGTLFSRRDSFITHRAFCDALAEESARTVTVLPPPPPPQQPPQPPNSAIVLLNNNSNSSSSSALQIPQFNAHHQDPNNNNNNNDNNNNNNNFLAFQLKKEHQTFTTSSLRPDLPPWLASCPLPPHHLQIDHSSSSSSILNHHHQEDYSQNPNPNNLGPTLPHFQSSAPPHMSATALLQKAAQMGATMSSKATGLVPHHHHNHQHHQQHNQQEQGHVSGDSFVDGLVFPFANKAVSSVPSGSTSNGALLQEMMNSLSSGFHEPATTTTPSFEDAFVGGIFNSKKDSKFLDSLSKSTTLDTDGGRGGGNGSGGGEGLTRDFLGLRAFSHTDILSMAGFGNCMNNTTTATSHEQHNQSQKTWQG